MKNFKISFDIFLPARQCKESLTTQCACSFIIVPEETSEELANLPTGVEFPNHLKDKIRYNATKQLLFYTGVMTEEEKEEILRLSKEEQYAEATRALFQKSQAFYFEICLDGLTFRILKTPPFNLQETDDKWILLKYGLEETERELRNGNKKDGHEISLIHAGHPGGNLPSYPEVSDYEKNKLQKFLDGEEISYSTP